MAISSSSFIIRMSSTIGGASTNSVSDSSPRSKASRRAETNPASTATRRPFNDFSAMTFASSVSSPNVSSRCPRST
jgi:hypothetical protein